MTENNKDCFFIKSLMVISKIHKRSKKEQKKKFGSKERER